MARRSPQRIVYEIESLLQLGRLAEQQRVRKPAPESEQTRVKWAQPYRAHEMITRGPEVAKEIAHPAADAEHSRRIAIQHQRSVDRRLSGVEIMPEIRNWVGG